MSILGKVKIGEATIEIAGSPPVLDVSVINSGTSTRGLGIGAGQGTLHGVWTADNILTTSDRRLKTQIEPLFKTLRNLPLEDVNETHVSGHGLEASRDDAASGDPALWLLRELRPVSYKFKSTSESKEMGGETARVRYGFIADELQSTLPDVVWESPGRETPGQREDSLKRVNYMDLIAVHTLFAQRQQSELEDLKEQFASVTKRYDEVSFRLELLSRKQYEYYNYYYHYYGEAFHHSFEEETAWTYHYYASSAGTVEESVSL